MTNAVLPKDGYFYGDGKHNPTNWKRLEKIGVGSFGKVHLASVQLSKRYSEVAAKEIKILEEHKIKYEKSIQTEINALRKLNHPRIVGYYGCCSKDFAFFIFMEYMSGGTLSKYIAGNNGPLNDQWIKTYTIQLLQGVQYLHSNRIIHRDIKSANILMDDYGSSIKLADFGVSKVFEDISKAYTTEIGTPKYMAPEIIVPGSHSYPVDIWASGCVVIEMITGDSPFGGLTNQQVYTILSRDNPSPVEFIKARLNNDAKLFLSKIFKKIPQERPKPSDLLDDPFLMREDVHTYVNEGDWYVEHNIETLLDETVINASFEDTDYNSLTDVDSMEYENVNEGFGNDDFMVYENVYDEIDDDWNTANSNKEDIMSQFVINPSSDSSDSSDIENKSLIGPELPKKKRTFKALRFWKSKSSYGN